MTLVLTLFGAAIATAAAVLGLLVSRLCSDPCTGWLGVALGADGLVTLSTSVPLSVVGGAAPTLHAVGLLVHGVLVALLTTAVFAPRLRLSRKTGTAVFCTAPLVAAVAGSAFPDAAGVVSPSAAVRLAVAAIWAVLASAFTVLAIRRRSGSTAAVGAGVALAGMAHAAGLTTAVPFGDVSPLIPSLRLTAAAVAAIGMLALVRRALTDLDTARDMQEEELRVAELRLVRTAERDHELRNGLAGLAGAATLLGRDRPEGAALGSAVASELTRLDGLLRSTEGASRATPTTIYAVAPVLHGLAMLRRSSGKDLELDVDPDLRAVGSPDTLAQVVVNLIANAERHAPGSPIRLSAARHHDRVQVVVSDHGPGIPSRHAQAVFAPGVRDPQRGGHGLGLSVCRRKLAAEDGTIAVLPDDPRRPGCIVMVELPAVPALDVPTLPVVGTGARCVAS